MKNLLVVLLMFGFATSAGAGMKVKAGSPGTPLAPNIVLGWTYNPATRTSHAILTANLPGIAFGGFPCFIGGIGVGGAGLDGAFGDLAFTMSVPFVTCYVKNISFQVGMEKPLAQQAVASPRLNEDVLNRNFYFGAGFAFGANPKAKSKILSGKPSARANEVDKLLALQADARSN